MHLMPPALLDPAIVRRCAAGADGRRLSDDDWEKCRGGAVVDVVAEGWGQGHARASVLGVAGMMATLAAAANGQAEVRRPHLVDVAARRGADVRADARPRWRAGATRAPQPSRLARDAAEVILSGLSYSHRAGTARTACEQVFDARRCRDIDWLAGKTGTPSFPSDGLLARRAGAPVPRRRRRAPSQAPAPAARCARTSGTSRPTAPTGARGPWTKAIAVLTERNWLQASGQVHGAGDHGPNPAAEIAHADRRAPRRPAGATAAVADEPTTSRLPAPLVWTFDGPFERCLADLEDTLRRAIVMVGDVSRVALLIDLSLPALQRRVDAGDAVQPAWGRFLERIGRYGLPAAPRVRHLRAAGPLATLVVAYRN